MNAIASIITSGLKFLETSAGSPTFTWKGQEVLCVPSSLTRSVVVDHEGNYVDVDCILFVRLAHFLTVDDTIVTIDTELYTVDDDRPIPLAGMMLVFRTKKYRIQSARESAPQSHVELRLVDPYANRT